MSGIIGILHTDGRPVDTVLLGRLTDFLAFRGPDAKGMWSESAVGLGHAMLRTTFEAKNEEQPLSLDGKVWLCADARVDGRAELISKLQSKRCDVSKETNDAQLILWAYQVWGEECLQHLIGDFSFAIWDSPRQRLFCARDHFGVTPFYYHQSHGQLIWSNTLNCLRSHPDVSGQLNEQAVGDYLLIGHNSNLQTTWFCDIASLPPAHFLVWTAEKGVQLQRYWAPPEAVYHTKNSGSSTRSATEVVEGFREVFSQAVTDRLRYPRVSMSLSGGMDSGSIAAVASQHRDHDSGTITLDAYSAGFDWLMPDNERYFGSLIAEKSHISTHYLSAEDCLIQGDIDRAWVCPPEPRFPLRRFTAWDIMAQISEREGRVMLGGLGGDPLLELPKDYWSNLIYKGHWGSAGAVMLQYHRIYGRRPAMRLRRNLPYWYPRKKREQQSPSPIPAYLNPDFARRIGLAERIKELSEETTNQNEREGMALSPFWSNALSSHDPDFSALPVKARHPFFDVRLLNFLTVIPASPWLFKKELLRAAMKGLLPEKIRTRPKSPLAGHFLHELARRGLEPHLEELSETPGLAEYIDIEELQTKIVELPHASPKNGMEEIVLPLSLAYWLRNRNQ